LKINPWNNSKTMVSGVRWAPKTSSDGLKVFSLPGQPKEGKVSCSDPATDAHPVERSRSDSRPEASIQGKIRALIKAILDKLVISPSFLLSSLVVFFFVPDSVLKGTYSIDIKSQLNEALRRSLNIIAATLGLALSAPLFLIIPILIKLDSPGSVIYKQIRVGQNRRNGDRRQNYYKLKGDRRNGDRRKQDHYGRLFVVYKFRSMRQDAEKKSGPVWAQKGDPRITTMGKFLRATRADELPQLFNVLKGDMSLIGPRPERPFFVNQFVGNISRYQERLNVKPGLTGLAQVMGGYDTCLDDVHTKLSYDLEYVTDRSLWRDMKILAKTVVVVLCGKGVSQ
jgi:lipopolysaccharide/colanic/teichoic acid biosynthesis glycosyltransferase